MKEEELMGLGYGVAIHFNEYTKKFEVYKIGTYHPSDPSINKESQVVSRAETLKEAVENFKKEDK